MRDIPNDRIDRASFRDVFNNGVWALRLAWSASPSIVAVTLFVGLIRSLVPVVMIVCVRGLVNDFQAGADVTGSMYWLMILPVVILGGAMASNLGTYVAIRLRDEQPNGCQLHMAARKHHVDRPNSDNLLRAQHAEKPHD